MSREDKRAFIEWVVIVLAAIVAIILGVAWFLYDTRPANAHDAPQGWALFVGMLFGPRLRAAHH